MVDAVKCEHCGAETKHPVTKVIDGNSLRFCCSGCLRVYELLREEQLQEEIKPEEPGARQSPQKKRRKS